MHDIKQKSITYVSLYLNEKLKNLNQMMVELNDASKNETKSTAGDKHEISKAMMHLEQEKLGNQIKEIEFQLKEFNAINFLINNKKVILGSLLETNKGYFFIATAVGKINIDNNLIFVISNKSPLGIKLMGLKESDSLLFGTTNYVIKTIN